MQNYNLLLCLEIIREKKKQLKCKKKKNCTETLENYISIIFRKMFSILKIY